MWTIVIASLAGLLVSTAVKLAVPESRWSLLFPFLLTVFGVGIFLLRRVKSRIDPLMKEVEKHILGGRREMALKSLEGGLRWARWSPMLGSQLRGYMGQLHYAMGNLDEAEANLAAASRWPWETKAILGCVHFKRRDADRMKRAFELAVKSGDKQPLAWTLYAHCLQARGDKDDAVKVLERGLKKLPTDERLKGNLELAKEGKKLKTAPYGDKWTQFGLEGGEGPVVPRAMRGFAARPGFRQRPQRKGKK
jgi:tetratricopeptide (TPR) repeat protein